MAYKQQLLLLCFWACTPPTPTLQPKHIPPSVDWADLISHYGHLETIAGKGSADNGNDWNPSYEGKSALNAELSRPHMAMADIAGNIYIADKEAHAIRKINPQGIISTFAGTNQPGDSSDTTATKAALREPNGLFVLPNGTVFILDLGNNKIKRVQNGQMTTLLSVPEGISLGRGLWVSSDESEVLFCSGSVLKRWTRDRGVHDFAWGFSDLGMVVKDPRGRIIVADRSLHRILWAKEGKVSVEADTIAGNGSQDPFVDNTPAREAPLHEVRAVWPFDGGFFLGTHEGSQLLFLDRKGIVHLFLDGAPGEHSGDGLPFNSPGKKISEVRSVTVDYQGNILIVESDAGFVRKVLRTP